MEKVTTLDVGLIIAILTCLIGMIAFIFKLNAAVEDFQDKSSKLFVSFTDEVKSFRGEITNLANKIAEGNISSTEKFGEIRQYVNKTESDIKDKLDKEVVHLHSRIDKLRETTQAELKASEQSLLSHMVTEQVCLLQHKNMTDQFSSLKSIINDTNSLLREHILTATG